MREIPFSDELLDVLLNKPRKLDGVLQEDNIAGVAGPRAAHINPVAHRMPWHEQGTDPHSSELLDLLKQLVDELPSKYREIIEGIWWEGLSETKMAQRLGCARCTVQRRKARALELLRQRLADAASS